MENGEMGKWRNDGGNLNIAQELQTLLVHTNLAKTL